nr:hypothetical protein [uncultured Anaerosporobacter sp.]
METKDIIQRILEEKVKHHKNFKLTTNTQIKKSKYIWDNYIGMEADFILSAKIINPYLQKKELRQICVLLNSNEKANCRLMTGIDSIDAIIFINDSDYMFTALEEIENLMDAEWIDADKIMTQERKAQEYLAEFWNELVLRTVEWEEGITDLIPPPINFYDERTLMVDAVSKGNNNIKAGFTWSTNMKNHVGISLALNPENNINKKMLRHETIHYLLNLKGYGNNDGDLAFWCYCKIFDGGAYEKIKKNEVPVYTKFISVYDEVMSMQDKVSFSLVLFEKMLFSFFKDYYENNMDTDEALDALDRLKKEIVTGLKKLSKN